MLDHFTNVSHLASAVMRAVQVPAVRVGLAGAAALGALVLVPAAHPGRVASEARQAAAAEGAHCVGAGRLLPAIRGAVEEDVVNVTLVNLVACGQVHVCLTVVTILAILIGDATSHIVAAPVVVLVTDSVAAVVSGCVSEPGGIVGILGCREVLGVKTEIVSAPGPPGLDTVSVGLAVALALPAGVPGGAPPLAAVILRVPPAPGVWTVVLATDHGALAVVVMVTVSPIEGTRLIRPAAMLPASAGSRQCLRCTGLHHDLLFSAITFIRKRVLQKC